METRRCRVRPATEADAEFISERLRQSDRDEIAADGLDARSAVVESFRRSSYCRTLEEDGVPFAIWGVGPLPGRPSTGAVWLVATDVLGRHRVHAGKVFRREVERMREGFGWIGNRTYGPGNVRWLESLGFSVADATRGSAYRRFAMEGKPCAPGSRR